MKVFPFKLSCYCLLLLMGTISHLKAQQAKVDQSKDTTTPPAKVVINTPFGEMTALLYNETPRHRDNFLKLVDQGFYDSLLFHRVIKNFMVQGGDPQSKNAGQDHALGNGGPGYTLPAEILPSFFHKKGALCAARQGDPVNHVKRSSGSQFYIVQGSPTPPAQLQQMAAQKDQNKKQALMMAYLQEPAQKALLDSLNRLQAKGDQAQLQAALQNLAPIVEARFQAQGQAFAYPEDIQTIYATQGGTPHLDGAYTVFGEVIEGFEVLDQLAAVATNQADRPLTDVWMTIRRSPMQ